MPLLQLWKSWRCLGRIKVSGMTSTVSLMLHFARVLWKIKWPRNALSVSSTRSIAGPTNIPVNWNTTCYTDLALGLRTSQLVRDSSQVSMEQCRTFNTHPAFTGCSQLIYMFSRWMRIDMHCSVFLFWHLVPCCSCWQFCRQLFTTKLQAGPWHPSKSWPRTADVQGFDRICCGGLPPLAPRGDQVPLHCKVERTWGNHIEGIVCGSPAEAFYTWVRHSIYTLSCDLIFCLGRSTAISGRRLMGLALSRLSHRRTFLLVLSTTPTVSVKSSAGSWDSVACGLGTQHNLSTILSGCCISRHGGNKRMSSMWRYSSMSITKSLSAPLRSYRGLLWAGWWSWTRWTWLAQVCN